MKIGTREVGPGHPVFIVAECAEEHDGSLRLALELVDTAADIGADAAKFQMYRLDRLYPRGQHEELRRLEMPTEWLPVLRDRCAARRIVFLCTAFDFDSLDAIDPYVPAHKIGSLEAMWASYVTRVVTKSKPILISNGASTYRWNGAIQGVPSIPMHCVSAYPTELSDVNLRSRPMAAAWGLSDHTLDPTTVPTAAVALGASVVEKHLRLEGHPHTPDYATAIGPKDFAAMVAAVRRTEEVLGSNVKAIRDSERPMVALRRGPQGLRGA